MDDGESQSNEEAKADASSKPEGDAGESGTADIVADPPESEEEESEGEDYSEDNDESVDDELSFSTEEDTEDGADPRTKVLSVLELEALFLSSAPTLDGA